jgi:hypothetical protein
MAMRRRAVWALTIAGGSLFALTLGVAPSLGRPLAPPRPHALILLINGKRLPITPLTGGTDKYAEITEGPLRVQAKWTTDARNTGYYILVSTTEPQARDYLRCLAGTSCVVPQKVSVLRNQEMSWSVKILTTRGNKLVSGFKVCVEGQVA